MQVIEVDHLDTKTTQARLASFINMSRAAIKAYGFSVLVPIAAYVRIRPNPGQLPKIGDLADSIPEIVECHRVTGEDCFILKVYLPSIDQLDRILDAFLLYGTTTTSLIQSSPVPLRPLPLPDIDA